MDINTPAIRKMLDLIKERFGEDIYVKMFSDGSGLLLHDGHGYIPRDTMILEFSCLGELAEEFS